VDAPLLAVAPILVGELPGFVADGLALFETAELLFAGNVDPELGEDGPEISHLSLEGVDLFVGALPGVFGSEAFHALNQHAAVPGAVEDGDLAALGKAAPETVEVVAGLVLALRRGDGIDHIATRVQLLGDPLDGAALAGGVPALKQNHHRAFLQVHLVAQFAELNLAPRHLADVGFAGEGAGEI